MVRGIKFGAHDQDPIASLNRTFGRLISRLNRVSQTVVSIVEGAAMGGGLGLVCVSDIVIARADAKFRLPETGLGLPPAQIAPFLVYRLGLPVSRRLALTGASLSGSAAQKEGLVDILAENEQELIEEVAAIRKRIIRCAPQASATTKEILLSVGTKPLETLLDEGAEKFAQAARGAEGMEGVMAFIQKRKPRWAEERS